MPLDATIQGYIDNANSAFGLLDRGISQTYLSTVAQLESGGNPSAAPNQAGAAGLFQFVPSTAAQFGLTNPLDPQASANAAAQLTLSNFSSLSNALGRAPTDVELYLAHQQGAAGAANLIQADPNALAAGVLGLQPTIQNLGQDFTAAFGINPSQATVGQFMQYWNGKYNAANGTGSGNIATGTTTQAPASGGSAASGSTVWTVINHYAVRIAVVVVGFLFIAAGLRLLGRSSAAPSINVNVTSPVHTSDITPRDPTKEVAKAFRSGVSKGAQRSRRIDRTRFAQIAAPKKKAPSPKIGETKSPSKRAKNFAAAPGSGKKRITTIDA